MKFSLFTALLLSAAVPFSFAEDSKGSEKNAAGAMNGQGLAMFHSLCETNSGNVFLSPFCVNGAFAMVYSGAKGETASEIQTALGLPENAESCGSFFADTAKQYEKLAPQTKVYVSNSVWSDKKQTILPSFTDIVKKYYNGAFFPEDFSKGAAVAQKINAYVEEHTNRMIKNLLSPSDITAATSMVLLNTLYFESDWKNPFPKNSTSKQQFTSFGGNQKMTDIMYQKSRLGYFFSEQDNVHGIILPYKDDRFALVALMPKDPGTDYGQTALKKITGELSKKLDSWIQLSQVGETQVWMPRIKLDYKVNLTPFLQKAGMKKAFGAGADFSGMSGNRELYISSVIHQTALEMDETTTRAAAATAAMISRTSLGPRPRTNNFRADRPFIAFIRDMETGLILFVGRIQDPGTLKK